MKESTEITLPVWIKEKLNEASRREKIDRSYIVRDALLQYFAREESQRLRRELVPEIKRLGIFTG